MNISKETIDILSEMFQLSFYDDNVNDMPVDKATNLHIGFSKPDNVYIGKTIKATKKEITVDYVLNKLNSEKTFVNFSNYFNNIISKYGLGAYPTTYGIGVFVAIGRRNDIQETKDLVEKALNDLGVQYTTEYSDAGWVFRYKISKSAENIERIKQITEGGEKPYYETGGFVKCDSCGKAH